MPAIQSTAVKQSYVVDAMASAGGETALIAVALVATFLAARHALLKKNALETSA